MAEFDLTTVIIVATVVLGVILGITQYQKLRFNDPKLLKNRLKEKEEYLNEIIKERNKWKTKYFNTQKNIEVNEPKDEGDLSSIIPSFISQFSALVPEKYRFILEDQDLQKVMIDQFLKDPKKTLGMLGKVIKGNKQSPQINGKQKELTSSMPEGVSEII